MIPTMCLNYMYVNQILIKDGSVYLFVFWLKSNELNRKFNLISNLNSKLNSKQKNSVKMIEHSKIKIIKQLILEMQLKLKFLFVIEKQ